MYNLVRMRGHWDNIQNNLFACSREFVDAQARSDLTTSLVCECEIKKGTEPNIVTALNEDNSNPIDNLEVPSEMFELPFDVEHEKLEHMDTYLSVGCLEPLPIPTEIVVGDDFATEAIDRVTTYLKGGEHHMFDGFPQKKGLIYFQVALLHIQLDPSLADFGGLALCESMKNGLPTCYWFDTGQHVCHSIPFVFRHKICDYHLSTMEFDKNGYRPTIGAQGGDVLIFAIMYSGCYSSGNGSKTALEEAAHNRLLDMLARHIVVIESYNSKVDQLFNAMSNEACKVFNVMSTSLLVRVLVETPKEVELFSNSSLKKEHIF
ncbi:hypothetical protein KY290_021107 [Solanum tuberosum]|uniref:Uncharacterized protein n=1 Tax=Solanum tuberosum TaxID=4113 RepID=A0ABQ7V257_SOLTU|nr:hypothetical protein KY289_020281 [Solanum tuberosum]KAH0692945.1 hypothetical protein KY285_020042 [Solanum tuberosum]KAH0757614.1 hypothetical protein KY290_021107 [Solanum tuberosum]